MKEIRVEPAGLQPGWAEPAVDTDALRHDQILEIHVLDRGVPRSSRCRGPTSEELFGERPLRANAQSHDRPTYRAGLVLLLARLQQIEVREVVGIVRRDGIGMSAVQTLRRAEGASDSSRGLAATLAARSRRRGIERDQDVTAERLDDISIVWP